MSGVEIMAALGYISTCQSIYQLIGDTFHLSKLSLKAYDQGGITNVLTNQYNTEWLEIIKSHKSIYQDINSFIQSSSFLMVDFLFLPSLLEHEKYKEWHRLLDINGDTPEQWATAYSLMTISGLDRYEIKLFFRCRDPTYYNIFHFLLVVLQGMLLILNGPSFGPTEDVEVDGEMVTEYHSSYKSRGSRMYDYLVSKLFEEVENTDSSMYFRQTLNMIRKYFKSKSSKHWKTIFINAAMLSNSIPLFHKKVSDAVDKLLEIFFPSGFEVNKTNQWIYLIKELIHLVQFESIIDKLKHPEFLFEEIVLHIFQQFLEKRQTEPRPQPAPQPAPVVVTVAPRPAPAPQPRPVARGKGVPEVVSPLRRVSATPEQLRTRSILLDRMEALRSGAELPPEPIDDFMPFVTTPDLSELFVQQTEYKTGPTVSTFHELCLRYPMTAQLGDIIAHLKTIFLMFNLSGFNAKERINVQISHFLIDAMECNSKYATQAINILIRPFTTLDTIEQQSRRESIKRMDAEYAALGTKQKKIEAMLVELPAYETEKPQPNETTTEFWDSKVHSERLQYEKDIIPKRSWTVKVSTETKPQEKSSGLLSWFRRGGKRTRKRVKRTRKT